MFPKARVALFGAFPEIQRALSESAGLEVVLQGREPFLWQETVGRFPLPAEILVVDARLFPQVWSHPFPPEAAVAAIGEGEAPSPLWDGRNPRRRFFPIPVDPFDVVGWAQWLFPVKEGSFSPRGAVMAVTGAKGGVGKTSMACHLALHMARGGVKTILLDLDLPASDAGLFLGMEHGPSVLELLGQMELWEKGGWMDRGRHPSGLFLVRGTGRPDLAQMVEPKDVVEMVGWAGRHFEGVVLDIPSRLSDDLFYQLLELSRTVILMVTPDPMALQRTALLLNLLAQMELPPEGDIRVVLNRVGPAGYGRDMVRHLLGRAPVAEIPEYTREGRPALPWRRGKSHPWEEAAARLMPLPQGAKPSSRWEELKRRWWR